MRFFYFSILGCLSLGLISCGSSDSVASTPPAPVHMPTNVYMGLYNGTVYDNNQLLSGNAITLPDGSPVNTVATESGNVYVGTTMGNVWVAINGQWQLVGKSSPGIGNVSISSIVVSGGVVYAGGSDINGGNVWFTESIGSSWQQVGESSPTPDGGAITTITVANNNIYAGGYNGDQNGVWVVTTGGSWLQIGSGSPAPNGAINSVVVDNYGRVYVGGADQNAYGGVWMAESIYANWLPVGDLSAILGVGSAIVSIAINDEHIYAGGYDTDGIGGVWFIESNVLDDWNLVGNSRPTPDGGRINSIVVNSNGIYAGGVDGNDIGGVWFTESVNSNWSQIGPFSLATEPSTVSAIAVAESNVYSGVNIDNIGEVLLESNGTWHGIVNTSLDSSNINSVLSIGRDVYAGTKAGDVWINRNGSGWTLLGESSPVASATGSITSLATSGDNIYASGNIFENGVSIGGRVWRSHISGDGGWLSVGDPVTVPENANVNVVAVSGNNVYVGGGFYNLGKVWVAQTIGSPWIQVGESNGAQFGGSVTAMAVNGDIIYVASNNDQVGWVWFTKGLTSGWYILGESNPAAPDVGVINAIVLSDDTIYVGGNDSSGAAVWMTTGFNNAWSMVGGRIPDTSSVTALAAIGEFVYAGTELGNIWFSQNGDNWVQLNYGILGVKINSISLGY